MMTPRLHSWIRFGVLVMILILAGGSTLLAQDIKGGAAEIGKRPANQPGRRRPRANQPRRAAR